MFDTILVTAARAGDTLGLNLWLPVLPSYANPTVEWAPGEVGTVARVEFPEGQPIAITLAGSVDDADRAQFLDRGWRVLPSTTNGVVGNPAKTAPDVPGAGVIFEPS